MLWPIWGFRVINVTGDFATADSMATLGPFSTPWSACTAPSPSSLFDPYPKRHPLFTALHAPCAVLCDHGVIAC